MRHFDAVIVGGGLAGCCAAWALHAPGRRIGLIDRGPKGSASAIAAGLVTPIVGKRMTFWQQYLDFFEVAVEFYRSIESETSSEILNLRTMLRIFQDSEEQALFAKRIPEFKGLTVSPVEPAKAGPVSAPFGGFEASHSGRVDISRLMQVTHARWTHTGEFLHADVDPVNDVRIGADEVVLPRFGWKCNVVIWCDGWAGHRNPNLGGIRFNPAKGEILTLEIPGLIEPRNIHCGGWLCPIGGENYLAGSTYDWGNFDDKATDEGQAAIEKIVQRFLTIPYRVVNRSAAVRPIVESAGPTIGFNQAQPRSMYLTGMGTRGAVNAPQYGRWLHDLLVGYKLVAPRANA